MIINNKLTHHIICKYGVMLTIKVNQGYECLSNVVLIPGVWIINGKDVFYNQFSTVTFLCPMRFERYPLDEHICKFRVGSTNMDINFMRFGDTVATFDESSKNTILDYSVKVNKLNEEDRIIQYQGQNYSVTGENNSNYICNKGSCFNHPC